MKRIYIAIGLAAAVIYNTAPALSQDANQNGPSCPENSATVGSGNHAGNSAGNPASQQGWSTAPFFPVRVARMSLPHQPSRRTVKRSMLRNVRNRRTNLMPPASGTEIRILPSFLRGRAGFSPSLSSGISAPINLQGAPREEESPDLV
jgi:hypothetical protein